MVEIILASTAINMDDSVENSPNDNKIKLVQKLEDVSEVSPDKTLQGERL